MVAVLLDSRVIVLRVQLHKQLAIPDRRLIIIYTLLIWLVESRSTVMQDF